MFLEIIEYEGLAYMPKVSKAWKETNPSICCRSNVLILWEAWLSGK